MRAFLAAKKCGVNDLGVNEVSGLQVFFGLFGLLARRLLTVLLRQSLCLST